MEKTNTRKTIQISDTQKDNVNEKQGLVPKRRGLTSGDVKCGTTG